MAKKGENITKRKDGRWEARILVGYNEKGRALYKSLYAKSYSEVKIKGLLKYKLTLLNYYFIFVTTPYIRWTMYSGNFNTPSTNTSRKTSHLHSIVSFFL